MSDDIEYRKGKHSHFYVGETPWHSLGQSLDNPPTTKEAIVAAGLDYPVTKAPLFMRVGADNFEQVSAFATVRPGEEPGTFDELGIVGPKYRTLQNEDAFDFFDPFLASGNATLETAGALSGGRRIWILAKLKGNDIPIVKNDIVQKYVLLSNSHDGSSPVRVGFTPIRVVCSNTLAAAHADKLSRILRIRHTGNIIDNLSMIQNALNVVNERFETTVDGYRQLAKKQINKNDLKKYVTKIFKKKENEDNEIINVKRVERVTELFETGIGNDMTGVEGTWWAAYNGLTQYLSYENGRTDDSRLNSLWFGEANGLLEQGLNVALEMIA